MVNKVETKSDYLLKKLIQVGTEITINIKVLDYEKCLKFINSNDKHNVNKLGLSVTSWANFNSNKAYELQIEDIEKQIARHKREMDILLSKSLYSFIAIENETN